MINFCNQTVALRIPTPVLLSSIAIFHQLIEAGALAAANVFVSCKIK